MQSCREQGLPEPKIEIVPNFVNLIIWFNDQLSAQDSPQVIPPPKFKQAISNQILLLFKKKSSAFVAYLVPCLRLAKCWALRIENGLKINI